MPWNPRQKPPRNLCPKEFCFHWRSPGDKEAPGLYETAEESLQHLALNTEGRCGWQHSPCRRLDPASGSEDFYEPHEPLLERNGLPWFYFVADVDQIVDELKDKYLQEVAQLWGMSGVEKDCKELES